MLSSLFCAFYTYIAIFSSLPALKHKTKLKGLPGIASDSEEDLDDDATGILGQRAARRAATIQINAFLFYSAID